MRLCASARKWAKLVPGRPRLNGSLKVNRSPVSAPLTFTNSGAGILKIPITGLLSNTSDPDADPLILLSFDQATTNGVTLSTDNTYIYYSNNVTVADRFTFTVGDGHGGSSTGVVNIAPSMNAQFVSHPNVNGNSVQVSFSGLAGATYYLERSTNLTVWQTISTNVMPSNGLLDFVDDFHDLNAPPSSASIASPGKSVLRFQPRPPSETSKVFPPVRPLRA